MSSSSAVIPSSTPESSSTSSISTTSSTSTTSSISTTSSVPSSSGTTSSASATGSSASSSNPSSAGPSSQSTTAPASSSSASVSASASVSVSNGQTVTVSVVYTTITDPNGNVITSASALPTHKSSGTNTGAIVGGVVGGVGGLIVILAIVFFIMWKKRKNRKIDFDDNMFDPGRSQNRASVDLADPAPNTVEPFYTPGVASTNVSPEMTQYARSTSTEGEGYNQQMLSRGPSSANSSAGFAGRGAGTYGAQQGVPGLPTIPAGMEAGAGLAPGAGAEMTAKQREAYHEQQRFHVANQGAQYGSGPSGSSPMSPTGTSASGPVTVHEDAGVVEPQYGSEIPPTYDSIRR